MSGEPRTRGAGAATTALFLLSLTVRPAAAQVPAARPEWRLVVDVPLPGKPARFDYQSFDASTGWLWISHMGADEVLVFDVRTRRVVARVPDMLGATGMRTVPALHRVFVWSVASPRRASIAPTASTSTRRIGSPTSPARPAPP